MLARIALLVAMLMLAGCVESDAFASRPTQCREPRPEICPQVEQPVCGVTASGGKKLYSNACMACGEKAVTGYLRGACK